MKVKCEYCDSFIDDTADFCPNCGAPNANVMRSGVGVPKTIEELKQFCNEKGMNLPQMRFFIGENYTGPRAFGIYKDGENFIVYKNKADGSRAVRYRGTDEAYAVNEIYQKLWSEVQTRRAQDISGPSTQSGYRPGNSSSGSSDSGGCFSFIFKHTKGLLIAIIVLMLGSCLGGRIPDRGYYTYNDNKYYYQNSKWYVYDAIRDIWDSTSVDDYLEDNYRDYYDSDSYSSSYGNAHFEDSDWYEAPSSNDSWSSSDWDSGSWDYDYGSWDSGGSDWDSDW
ncbi:MAG: zinc ribbon domain-containing protein [Lachnospiraceae bacterium]|nr:zinc ribbon domain-containing protein [Lachnospiraceae bacterium]